MLSRISTENCMLVSNFTMLQVLKGYYCPENLDRGWIEPTKNPILNGIVRCSDCDLYPASKECGMS